MRGIDDEDFVAPFVRTQRGRGHHLADLLDADHLPLAGDFDEVNIGMHPPLDTRTGGAIVAFGSVETVERFGDAQGHLAQRRWIRTVAEDGVMQLAALRGLQQQFRGRAHRGNSVRF